MDVDSARSRLNTLQGTLMEMTARDGEQEVMGMAIPVMDAVLTAVRDLVPHDPVLQAVCDVVSADAIANGQGVRAFTRCS